MFLIRGMFSNTQFSSAHKPKHSIRSVVTRLGGGCHVVRCGPGSVIQYISCRDDRGKWPNVCVCDGMGFRLDVCMFVCVCVLKKSD